MSPKPIFLKTLLTFCVALLLFGCSVYPDVNKDPAKNNKATFQRDAVDCAQAYPEAGSGVHVKERIRCMNLKGWY
ncbi:hypothetical protein [Polynucleobacter sp. es-MAR-4]|uniref:hypothetical protein n=1 Tax=Polynucleobacter sp. es-MAR-4 TaxID=1855655 RepID=UPI001C0B014F|nr:hypothetical protein [Polynucleobacter sp. es-MAR-4]MBU3637600.1 hypothetical protein [Polynucleobacter sp. es-MAR-4]